MTTPIIPVLLVALASLSMALVVTPLVRSFANRLGIGDRPNARKVHTRVIPRMGGIGIVAGFVAGIGVWLVLHPELFIAARIHVLSLLAGMFLVIMLGIVDDVRGIGSAGKLLIQGIAAFGLTAAGIRVHAIVLPFLGPIQLGVFSWLVTWVWIVGITNAVNLIDGLDGLAAGVAAIVALCFALIGKLILNTPVVVINVALVFACLGFLRYNFHPATIFMGDSGSLFLGFMLASMSLHLVSRQTPSGAPISFLVPIVALALPILDTSVAFTRRLKKGMHPLRPDKEHYHHRLMDLGLTHRQTVFVTYAVSGVLAIVAFLLVSVDDLTATVLLLIVVGGLAYGVWRLGYLEELTSRRRSKTPVIQPLNIARMIDTFILAVVDAAMLTVAFGVLYWFFGHSRWFLTEEYVPLLVYLVNPYLLVMVSSWLALFFLAGLYDLPWDLSLIDHGWAVVKTVLFGTVALFLISLDMNVTLTGGRAAAAVHGAMVAVLVLCGRFGVIAAERRLGVLGARRRRTIIVGTGRMAMTILKDIRGQERSTFDVVGIVGRGAAARTFEGLPPLGRYAQIPEIVRRHHIEEVLVATEYRSRAEVLGIVARCKGIIPEVKVAPSSIDVLSGFRTEEIDGLPFLRIRPMHMKQWQWSVKRLIDIIVSLTVLVPLLPIWIVVGGLIRLDSAGPAVETFSRVGRHGEPFKEFRFRIAERSPKASRHRRTSRIMLTRVGRLLKRTHLDGVPRFLNVIWGDMSLVGPSAEPRLASTKGSKGAEFASQRLLVRPGITGWAQTAALPTSAAQRAAERMRLDLTYLENLSLRLDFKIILRTIWLTLTRKEY